MPLTDIFHVGPPKTATTWLYHCMSEHPGVSCTYRDAVHYYDMFYSYGPDWYANQFVGGGDQAKRLDTTQSYIQSCRAIERLAQENPAARVIIGLRDPVERAFSHYWHLKKKGKIRYTFDEVLENYTLFSLWVEPGLIGGNIRKLLEYIPRSRVYAMHYKDLVADPANELMKVFRFCGLDETIRPSALETRINAAGPRQTVIQRAAYRGSRILLGEKVHGKGKIRLVDWISGKREYQRGVSREKEASLKHICEPDIEEIESALDIDLSEWRDI